MHPESLHLGDQLFYLIDQTRLRAQAIQAVAITPLGVAFRVVLAFICLLWVPIKTGSTVASFHFVAQSLYFFQGIPYRWVVYDLQCRFKIGDGFIVKFVIHM